jgi:two-component system, NarL family, response regulator LiaR
MPDPIRLLIVDDHVVVRKGLRMLFTSDPAIEVIGEAGNGLEAIEQTSALNPDLILMDLQMPKMNGIDAIQAIKQHDPAIKILVLTSFADDQNVFPAIKGGASGYILKDALPDDLLEAVHRIARGEPSLDPAIAERLMKEIAHPTVPPVKGTGLTQRELEILQLVAQGNSNHEIAVQLVIGDRTVTTHIQNILSKLHLANRTQAALYAIREGLIPKPPEV